MTSSLSSLIIAWDCSRTDANAVPCLPRTAPAASLRMRNTTFTSLRGSSPTWFAATLICSYNMFCALTAEWYVPWITTRRGPASRFVTEQLQPQLAPVCLMVAPSLPTIAPTSLWGMYMCSWICSGSSLGGLTFDNTSEDGADMFMDCGVLYWGILVRLVECTQPAMLPPMTLAMPPPMLPAMPPPIPPPMAWPMAWPMPPPIL
mmetsp:Transcript_86444/g.241903  ORF Transcript_86444/g.241903 Transcript_86444/m.241903 type:complete len:204 (-) Transcript_86444:623-1234(-)